jgi:hypothetical protein
VKANASNIFISKPLLLLVRSRVERRKSYIPVVYSIKTGSAPIKEVL